MSGPARQRTINEDPIDRGAPVVPVVPVANGAIQVAELYRDHHTIRLRMVAGCLERGDSGMLFINESNKLVGMLISGARRCEGNQTVLRLHNLASWIHEHTHT